MTKEDEGLLQPGEFRLLFHIRSIEDLDWDALNAALLMNVRIGPQEGGEPTAILPLSVSPEAVAQLARMLPIALAERPPEGRATQ